MKKFNYLFLSKEEVEVLNNYGCSSIEIKFMDVCKNWWSTSKDEEGKFTLALSQLKEGMKVSIPTVTKVKSSLTQKGILTITKNRNRKHGDIFFIPLFSTKENNFSSKDLDVKFSTKDEETLDTIYTSITNNNNNYNNKTKTTYMNNSNETMVNTTSTCNNSNANFEISFTKDGLTISGKFEGMEQFKEVVEYINALEVKHSNTSSVVSSELSNASKVIPMEVISPEEYYDRAVEKRNITEASTTAPSDRKKFNDKVGEAFAKIETKLNELNKEPLDDTTEYKCVGDGKYPTFINSVKGWRDANTDKFSEKQLQALNVKLDKLEKAVKAKMDNIRKYFYNNGEETTTDNTTAENTDTITDNREEWDDAYVEGYAKMLSEGKIQRSSIYGLLNCYKLTGDERAAITTRIICSSESVTPSDDIEAKKADAMAKLEELSKECTTDDDTDDGFPF